MSVNTENLITTAHGLARLAKIQEVSEALRRDGKNVSISLVFSHFAFSTKSSLDLDELYDIDPVDAYDEAATSPVDVCQVQSFSVIEDGQSVQKRDFTLSANFDIPEVVTGIKTILLYCIDHIVDNRTDEEKEADGTTHVEILLARDYDYHASDLYDIFAYTRVLDETGTYQPNGISVGASVYGRSRIRVHFNYIIDDINAAEVINVESNIYPYSSGYLSQRAFNEGIRRYEEALETYRMDWERFAKGLWPVYDNMAEAFEKSSPRNKFIVRFNELEAEFNVTDLEANSGVALDTYKDYTAPNYEMSGYSRKEQERGTYYSDTFMKPVVWKHIDSETGNVVEDELYCAVYIQALYYLRTGLPMENTSGHAANTRLDCVSTYHVMRFAIHIMLQDTEVEQIGEFMLAQNDFALFPQVPHVGKIYLDSSGPQGLEAPVIEFGIVTEGLEIKNTISQNDKVEFLERVFMLSAKTENPTPTEQLSVTQKFYAGAQGYYGPSTVKFDYNHSDPGSHGYSGDENIFRRIAPNFPGGNVAVSFMYGYFVNFIENDFDIKTWESGGRRELINTDTYDDIKDTVSIFGDLPVLSNLYDGSVLNQYGDSTNGVVDASTLMSAMSSDRSVRIMSDSHLHNYRAIVTANDWAENKITPVLSTIYKLYVMGEGMCKEFSLITNALLTPSLTGLSDTDCIQNIRVKRIQGVGDDISVTLLVSYKASTGKIYRQKEMSIKTGGSLYPYGNTNDQFVTVLDSLGNLGISLYSSMT